MYLSSGVTGGGPTSCVTVPCRGAELVKERDKAAPWEGAFRDASHDDDDVKDRTGQPSTSQASVCVATPWGLVKCGF